MIPTNVRNIQIAKKKRRKKKKVNLTESEIIIFSKKYLKQREIDYLYIVASQKAKELAWREQRILLGFPWACGFDKKNNIKAVGRSA